MGGRAFWLNVKASYWFIPSILTILAFFGALAMISIDRNGGSEWLTRLGWFEPSRPEGARAQLTVIASAAIAISSTVFAITISAVAYASGNYGPRLLTNFMNDRGNQISLGVFISTFLYNLMVLRVIRNPQSGTTNAAEAAAFVPQISVVVSTISVVIAVAVLVYFLHHIPASIRINSVLGGIGRHLIRDIEARFPLEGGADEPPPAPAGEQVTAAEIGYIEIIDFAALDKLACEAGIITLKVRTGDFVHPHLPLVGIHSECPSDKLRDQVRSCFSLGDSRTATQDLEFLIDELVEIALRALSPGVNDPFTAITSIHWMGAAIAKLADRSLTAGPEQKSYDPARVRPMADDFAHYLRRSFGGVRASAAANATAALIFIETLRGVAAGATSADRRDALLDEARRLADQAQHELDGPALSEIRERVADFEQAVATSRSASARPLGIA